MKITICGSIQFTKEMKELSDKLVEKGHVVEIPDGAMRILSGERTMKEHLESVDKGEGYKAKMKYDAIRKYFEKIKESDCVLIANYTKKNIEGYIGGNTFLEIGFAYVLRKPIYLLYPIPEMAYKDEIIVMSPIVINGDLDKIPLTL